MLRLCGCGVPNENTIEAGQRALAHRRWDTGKKLLDRAWQRDPKNHREIIDVCDRAVDRAAYKYQTLGDGPEPATLNIAPGVEPDEAALAKLHSEQVDRKKAYEASKKNAIGRLHQSLRLAKRYDKRLLKDTKDPVALGNLCTHIATRNKALSATSPDGYDGKYNQRAYDYFSRAIEAYDEAHLPQAAPVAGRMDIVADRLMHTSEHWYKRKQKEKMRGATGALLDDFVRLINIPTSHDERVQNLESLTWMLQRELPAESRTFMLNEVMAPLAHWLCDPSEEAAALRTCVLRVFEQIIYHQEWARVEAGDTLHRFVSDTSLPLTLEHMGVLYPCYRGLVEDKSKTRERFDILPDLEILRTRMHDNEKALVQVLVLLDDLVRFGSSRFAPTAIEMVRAIGLGSTADNVQYSALIILDHLAAFDRRANNTPAAVDGMAALISHMQNPNLRDFGIIRIAFHNAHPARLDAADHALYTTLGLQRSDVEKLLSTQKEIYHNISGIETSSTVVAR